MGESETPSVIWETFIPLKPVPCPRPRVTTRGTFMPGDYKAKKKRFIDFLSGAYRGEMIHDPIGVQMIFHLPKPKSVKRPYPSVRPDTDNYAKTVLDALQQAGIMKDDALVIDMIVSKRYAESERVGVDLVIFGA